MKTPRYLEQEQLAQIVEQLQRIFFYDERNQRWDALLQHDRGTLQSVTDLLYDHDLAPNGQMGETEARIASLAERLQEAPAPDDIELAVDDLVHKYCGAAKQWSSVNGQGYLAQVESLVKALGIEEAETLLNETLEFLAHD